MERHFSRHKTVAVVAGRLSSLLTVAMHTLVRKASGTRITLVKKRCAWHLRVKLQPHSELPYAKGEEFLEVMSPDRGAGARPVGRRKLKQQWSSSNPRCRGECACEKSLRAAQGAQVRASTAAFGGEDPLHDPWSHEGCGESRTMMGGRNLFWCV